MEIKKFLNSGCRLAPTLCAHYVKISDFNLNQESLTSMNINFTR